MNTTTRRRLLDQRDEAQPPCSGDAFSDDTAQQAAACRTCLGTGTVSRIVPLADAVLITDRACPDCAAAR